MKKGFFIWQRIIYLKCDMMAQSCFGRLGGSKPIVPLCLHAPSVAIKETHPKDYFRIQPLSLKTEL
jgi:hypothetical protein